MRIINHNTKKENKKMKQEKFWRLSALFLALVIKRCRYVLLFVASVNEL